MKIALIHWTDTCTQDDRHYTADDDFQLVEMVSCGLYIKQDEKSVTIAVDALNGGEYRYVSTVYKNQINKLIILDVR